MQTTSETPAANQRLKEIVRDIVVTSVKLQSSLEAQPLDLAQGDETPLFGEHGQLDSMSLVSLVVEIEEQLERELNLPLVIASAKAMSARRSPFATIGSLVQHVLATIEETEHV